MDTNALKKFAQAARNLLLEQVEVRLAQVLAAGVLRSQQRRGQGVASPVAPWLPSPVSAAPAAFGMRWAGTGQGGLQEPARGWKGVAHALDRLAVPAVR